MAFDEVRYEQEVIRPMRGKHGRISDNDLVRVYAYEPGTSADALQAHLRKLRTYWNQRASGPDNRARVCKQLLAADEELRRRLGAQLNDPAWWERLAQKTAQAAQESIKQLADDLVRAYGAIGQVTREQLAVVAERYPALKQPDVDEACRQAAIQVVDTVELPQQSGLDRVAYRELRDKLRELGALTIVHLLHPGLDRPFTLVRGFSVPGGPALALSPEVLRERRSAAEKEADSSSVRARKRALGVLDSGLKQGADLPTVALFQVVELCAAERAKGIADVLLVRLAADLGLAPEDARLLVASLPTGVDVASNDAAEVRVLLADGQLRAAQQALAALPDSDPERAAVEQAVQRQLDELRRLAQGAETALRERREEEAERLLREAVRIAADDRDLAARLNRLPPPPPRDAALVATGTQVRVSWRPPNTALPDLRYLVIRVEGRAPTGPDDGTRVGETAATSVTEPSVVAAREVHYGVFAAASGGTWSRPALVVGRVVPPVGDVRLRTRADEIAASWHAHPDLVAVRVCRQRSRPPADVRDGLAVPSGRTSFVDREIDEGAEYFYGVVAVYHDERHREVAAPMTVVSASPRAAGQPVEGLTAVPEESFDGGVARVRLTWPVRFAQVRIRSAPELPGWAPGKVVPVADMERYGQEVVGAQVADGDLMVLDADVPLGPRVYVPFTLGGTGAVVGRGVELGLTEPVGQLRARRTGTRAVLTWVWPADVRLAEVAWAVPGTATDVRRVSRAQYVDGDGCVVKVGPAGGTATVRGVSIGPTGESLSPPASVTVSGSAVRLAYTVKRPPGFRDRLSRRRVVEVRTDQDCADVDLTIVVAPGLAMPVRVEPGMTSFAFTRLRFTREVPMLLSFEVSAAIRRPYWIRCFVVRPATVTLVDPPVANMKVA
ncbi:MAG TPA: hypothetical protein VFC00_20045 [Micromonosporaceae bacterium]|nr:hypothetical protein [Micromonosporaceae bacterium]